MVRPELDTYASSTLASNVRRVQTPNFAMVPADVPQIEEGPTPQKRTTLQHIKPPDGLYPVPQWDVRVDWYRDGVRPPSSILLDFMFGVAVVKRWTCDDLEDILEKRNKDDFNKVLEISTYSAADLEDDESAVESDDDRKDPPGKGKQKGRKPFSSDVKADVLKAMDRVVLLSRFVRGTTPQSMAAEWERRTKEKEQCSQERSCEKVRQWLDPDASVSAFVKCLFPSEGLMM